MRKQERRVGDNAQAQILQQAMWAWASMPANTHTHTHHVELAGHQPPVLSGHIPLLTSVSCTDHWHVADLATSRCATTTIGHAPHSLPTRALFETPQLLLLHARMPTHSSSGPYDGLG